MSACSVWRCELTDNGRIQPTKENHETIEKTEYWPFSSSYASRLAVATEIEVFTTEIFTTGGWSGKSTFPISPLAVLTGMAAIPLRYVLEGDSVIRSLPIVWCAFPFGNTRDGIAGSIYWSTKFSHLSMPHVN